MSEKIRRVAVVGCGFAGLSLGFQLAKKGIFAEFFEAPHLPSASSIATGLLHLFHGAQARIPPFAKEAMEESLLQLSAISGEDHKAKITLVRPALNKMQESIFAKQARKHPVITQYKALPWDPDTKALWIYDAYWVNSSLYLEKLREHLKEKGCLFFQKHVNPLLLEKDYDQIVLACGYASLQIDSLRALNLDCYLTRGQIGTTFLEKGPDVALNGKTYLIPKENQVRAVQAQEAQKWIFGSTFEKLEPDFLFDQLSFEAQARQRLCEQTQALWPSIDLAHVDWKIGYRLAGPGHLPWIGKVGPKTFVFTGLGSKGLLYAAFLAKKLVHCIIENPLRFHFQLYSQSS